jgi:replication-associated recombination protein RarA
MNDLVLEKIINAKKANKLSHAYLITGPKNSGKFDLALSLAKNVFCENGLCHTCVACKTTSSLSNPDLFILESEGEIKISDVREMQKIVQLRPYAWPKKVVIVKDAHKLNKEASNALLKTLEEPPSSTVIILTSSGDLLQTIKSRCQELKMTFLDFASDDIESPNFLAGGIKKSQFLVSKEIYDQNINLFKKVISSDINTRFSLVSEVINNNEEFFFESIEIFLRQEIYQKVNQNEGETQYLLEDILNIVDKMQKTKEYIGVNVNPKLALENFFLNI